MQVIGQGLRRIESQLRRSIAREDRSGHRAAEHGLFEQESRKTSILMDALLDFGKQ
jgi:hypothetical protein